MFNFYKTRKTQKKRVRTHEKFYFCVLEHEIRRIMPTRFF